MLNKPYIPIPVFVILQDDVDQYKTIYADEKPHQVISQWLTVNGHSFISNFIDVCERQFRRFLKTI
jgi:hypothetical protein